MQHLKTVLRLRHGKPLSLGYFHDRRLQRWVDAKLATGTIDRVFVFSSSMAGYVMHAKGVRRILDMVDVNSEKWTAYAETARFPARAVWAREGRTLLAFERYAAAHFDHSLFAAEHEWQRFVTLAPETVQRTSWVSNGVDSDYFSPAHHFVVPFRTPGRRTGVHRAHGLPAERRRHAVVRPRNPARAAPARANRASVDRRFGAKQGGAGAG